MKPILISFAVGFGVAACGSDPPTIIVQPTPVIIEPAPTPTPSASSSADADTVHTSAGPSALPACGPEPYYGNFTGSIAQGAVSMVARPSFDEERTADGRYVTTITFYLHTEKLSWTDPVHGESWAANYWPLSVTTLPYAAPRTDTFAAGKTENVVLGTAINTQVVCAEDGTSEFSGTSSGSADETPAPAATISIAQRTADRLAGTIIVGSSSPDIQPSTLTFDVALGDGGPPATCCM